MATTVTLSILRSWLERRCSGMASSLTPDEKDDYLEYIFRYVIPHRVGGYLTDGEWSKATVASTPDYDLGQTVHSVHGPVLLDGNELETFTDIDNWYADHDPTDTTTNQPTSALIYGTMNASYATGYNRPSVRLYPIPDGIYTISGAGRLYPTIDLSSSDGNTLLTDQVLVRAMLAGAALEVARDYDLERIERREYARFEEAISMLGSRSVSVPPEHAFRRTF